MVLSRLSLLSSQESGNNRAGRVSIFCLGAIPKSHLFHKGTFSPHIHRLKRCCFCCELWGLGETKAKPSYSSNTSPAAYPSISSRVGSWLLWGCTETRGFAGGEKGPVSLRRGLGSWIRRAEGSAARVRASRSACVPPGVSDAA